MTIQESVLAIIIISATLQAQPPKRRFEVASVRREPAAGAISMLPKRLGDRVLFVGAPLVAIVQYAYGIKPFQMEGHFPPPPDDLYRIEAKTGALATDEDVREMFKALLEDRFKMQAHFETREMRVQQLIIGKHGSQLHHSNELEKPLRVAGKDVPEHSVRNYGRIQIPHLVGRKATTNQLAEELLDWLNGEPLIDMTGLTGNFDFELFWTEDGASELSSGPTLLDALQAQLGLSLRGGKAPVRILVIDHVQAADSN
jgi:uncharacterized protein (TIGR03435 family)